MSRTSTMLLLTGDYADRLDALYERAQDVLSSLQAAERRAEQAAASRRLDETPEHVALREEYDSIEADYKALKAEAEAAGVRVVLQSIGRKEWRELRVKHPPRVADVDEETQRGDRLAGVNIDTIEDDLVHASLVEPTFGTRADFDAWVDDLSEGDFQAILARAWGLVNVPRVDPKSLPGSLTRINGAS